MKNHSIRNSTLVGLLTVIMTATMQAQTTYTWNSPTTGTVNWSAADWSPSTPTAGGAVGNTLNFANGTYTADNDLAGTFFLGTLNANSGSGELTLSGNDLEFTNNADLRLANNSTGPLTVYNDITLNGSGQWYITPNGDITLNGVISGAVGGTIYVTDAGGMVTFANANNSFTSPLAVNNNGSLVANETGAFGTSTTSILLPATSGQSTTVGLYGGGNDGVVISQRIDATALMGAGGTRTIGSLSTANSVEFGNYIDGPDGQALDLYSAPGGYVFFDVGVIGAPSRTTSVIYDGGGAIFVFGGDGSGNTYSGTTTLRNGYIILQANDTGSAGNYSLGGSPFTTAVQLGDSLTPAGAPTSLETGDNFTISHNIVVSSYVSLAVIGGGSAQGSTWTGNIALQNNVYLQDYTDGLDSDTFSGQISGSGGIIITGNGTVTLTAENTFSGGTTVLGGMTLDVQNDGGLGSGGVAVMAGSTLILEDGVNNTYISASNTLVLYPGATADLYYIGTNNIDALSFDGGSTFITSGTWGAPGSGAPNINSALSGTGFLNVLGVPYPWLTNTNSLARVMNAAYAPGLQIDGTGAAWANLPSSTLYMDTSANSSIGNLGVNMRYAWDYTNFYILVSENTNYYTETDANEAPDQATYISQYYAFDGIGFWMDLNDTAGKTYWGVTVSKLTTGDFNPWAGFSSAGLTNIWYARANESPAKSSA